MFRNITCFVVPFVILSVGCGKSDPVADNASNSATPVVASATVPATQVVSEFLDLVRRGGEDNKANLLLTAKARAELKKIGRSIELAGIPNAHYKVTRAEDVPDEENAQVVHTVWTEPLPDGKTEDTEVVWAVQLENGNWRISGMAMELAPGQPMIVNFEDGDMMAKILGVQSETPPAQAQVPADSKVR